MFEYWTKEEAEFFLEGWLKILNDKREKDKENGNI